MRSLVLGLIASVIVASTGCDGREPVEGSRTTKGDDALLGSGGGGGGGPVEGGGSACFDPDDPSARYVGHSPDECALIDFGCEPGQVLFSNAEGCGCVDASDDCTTRGTLDEPTDCPDPSDPKVRYVSDEVDRCALIDFGCALGETLFSNECGCGCVGTP